MRKGPIWKGGKFRPHRDSIKDLKTAVDTVYFWGRCPNRSILFGLSLGCVTPNMCVWPYFQILITYLLQGAVFLEKLIGLQLVKNFVAFYGTRKFVKAVTTVQVLLTVIKRKDHNWRTILVLAVTIYRHVFCVQGVKNKVIPLQDQCGLEGG
jgi:hypothetical protein